MLTIDNTALQAFPGVKAGLLAMRRLSPDQPLQPLVIPDAMDTIRGTYGHLSRAGLKTLYPIQVYVNYYRKFGYSYHVLAQLESVLKGKKQFQTQPGLLQAMFITEVESMLLTAGYDLARLRPPLRLKAAAGNETYRSISGKEVSAVAGDLILCDGNGIISSILRGPDFDSRITAETTEALYTLYAPPGITADSLYRALSALEARIRTASPAAETICLRVYA